MPWYDYQCEKCGSVFEVQHAMGESGQVKCKHCGSTHTVKIYGATGVLFKGSGFYVTDSRSHNSAATTNGNGSNGSSTEHVAPTPAAEPVTPPAKSEPVKKA